MDRRWFEDMGELDQTEHAAFVSSNLRLKSRTTLIGEARIGAKSYAGFGATFTPVVSGAVPTTTEGKGKGRGMGPSVREPSVSSASSDQESARLVSVLARVAQSLGDRTGAWVQYSQRWTSGGVPPAVVSTPALFFDDGVYDDPFASDARSVGTGVKHVFASGAAIQAFGGWRRKDYRGTPAFGADGSPLATGEQRSDRITAAGAGLRDAVAFRQDGTRAAVTGAQLPVHRPSLQRRLLRLQGALAGTERRRALLTTAPRGALAELRLQDDLHVDALPDALRHHAEVLE